MSLLFKGFRLVVIVRQFVLYLLLEYATFMPLIFIRKSTLFCGFSDEMMIILVKRCKLCQFFIFHEIH